MRFPNELCDLYSLGVLLCALSWLEEPWSHLAVEEDDERHTKHKKSVLKAVRYGAMTLSKDVSAIDSILIQTAHHRLNLSDIYRM